MGSYGMSPSRLMGAVVELNHDQKGVMWPESVAPFDIHLVQIDGGDESVISQAEGIYDNLQKEGFEVLYDNRTGRTAGEKLNDADLIGIPLRIIISKKTWENQGVELKRRRENDSSIVKISELINHLKKDVQ